MTSSSITPRIHALDDDSPETERAAPAVARTRRGIDYAELVRDARRRSDRAALREALRAHAQRLRSGTALSARGDDEDTPAQASPPGAQEPPDDALEDDASPLPDSDDDDADALAGADRATLDARLSARAKRIDAQTQPFVAALGIEQLRVIELMRFVAAHVADFCGDDAVLENGNWTVRLKLDDALLPGCTLELHLSHFEVMLRFDSDSHSTRQLICRHVPVLKEQLVNMLRRLAVQRHVSIEAT
jgi:type III secretion control protein HpaP